MSQAGEPTSPNPVQAFIDVRARALKALEARKRDVDSRLASPDNVARVHYTLVAFGGYLVGVFFITPTLHMAIAVQPWMPTLPFAAAVLAFLVVTVVLAIPTILPFLPPKEWRVRALFFFTLVLYPLIFTLALALPAVLTGVLVARSFWQIAALIALTLGFLLVCEWVSLFMFQSGMPRILFLLWTSMRAGEPKKLFPSYEELLSSIYACTRDDLSGRSTLELEQIEAIAQRKMAGINGRLQSLSLAIGSLALLGLLTLVLTGDQIAEGLNVLGAWLRNILSPSTAATAQSVTVTQVLAAFLLLIVLGVLRYVMSAYLELRLLEIISATCTMHLAEQSASAQTPPTPAVQLAPAAVGAAPQTVSAAPQARQERPVLMILLGALTLLTALIYRTLKRLARTQHM